jgi:hypothetical protein
MGAVLQTAHQFLVASVVDQELHHIAPSASNPEVGIQQSMHAKASLGQVGANNTIKIVRNASQVTP